MPCRLSVEYLCPAFLDDMLRVTAVPVKVGASSCIFSQKILCGDKEAITAEVLVVCVRQNPLRPVKMPAPLASVLKDGLANGIKPSFLPADILLVSGLLRC